MPIWAPVSTNREVGVGRVGCRRAGANHTDARSNQYVADVTTHEGRSGRVDPSQVTLLKTSSFLPPFVLAISPGTEKTIVAEDIPYEEDLVQATYVPGVGRL